MNGGFVIYLYGPVVVYGDYVSQILQSVITADRLLITITQDASKGKSKRKGRESMKNRVPKVKKIYKQ